jgi:hypothetical protein
MESCCSSPLGTPVSQEAVVSFDVRYAPVFVWSRGVVVLVTHYRNIDEARAAAERLADSRR